jgi:transposase
MVSRTGSRASPLPELEGRMEHCAGIGVSLDTVSVCVVDGAGKVLREAQAATEPEALVRWFRGLGFVPERIGREAGPLSQWLHASMREKGLPVAGLETRHVRAAFKTMPVKTDRKDARGIAQLVRMGWLRPVHRKSAWCMDPEYRRNSPSPI